MNSSVTVWLLSMHTISSDGKLRVDHQQKQQPAIACAAVLVLVYMNTAEQSLACQFCAWNRQNEGNHGIWPLLNGNSNLANIQITRWCLHVRHDMLVSAYSERSYYHCTVRCRSTCNRYLQFI